MALFVAKNWIPRCEPKKNGKCALRADSTLYPALIWNNVGIHKGYTYDVINMARHYRQMQRKRCDVVMAECFCWWWSFNLSILRSWLDYSFFCGEIAAHDFTCDWRRRCHLQFVLNYLPGSSIASVLGCQVHPLRSAGHLSHRPIWHWTTKLHTPLENIEKFHRGILCPHREMQQSSLCVQMFYSIWNNIVQYTWMLDTCYIQDKPLLTDAIHCQSVFTSKAARRSAVFTYVTRHCPLERRTCEGPTSLSSPPPPSSPRGH